MVLQEIKDRYSVRSFSDRIPSDEVINTILEAGRLAPSWVNVQPWHFIAVRNQETKELLSQLANGQPHVAQAPVVIACCGDLNAWERENFKKILEARPGITEEKINTMLNNPVLNPKLKGQNVVLYRTIEELTYAIAYMTLEAQEQSLGACIVGAIGNELTGSVPDVYAKVREKLELPENIILITLLLLGYPDPQLQKFPKNRKQFDEVISYEKFRS